MKTNPSPCYPCEIRLGYPKGADYNKIIDAKILSIKIINGIKILVEIG
nr:MAG TPA: hypothetical protein [Caudoviricetes sp.]